MNAEANPKTAAATRECGQVATHAMAENGSQQLREVRGRGNRYLAETFS